MGMKGTVDGRDALWSDAADPLHNSCIFVAKPRAHRPVCVTLPPLARRAGLRRAFMKTHNIEIQRVKSMAHDVHGMVHLKVDALVQTVTNHDDEPSSVISLTEANLRVLQALIKNQLLELDKRKARSRF
jgi:hypothetical protein